MVRLAFELHAAKATPEARQKRTRRRGALPGGAGYLTAIKACLSNYQIESLICHSKFLTCYYRQLLELLMKTFNRGVLLMSLTIAAAAVMVACSGGRTSDEEVQTIRIIAMNDFHGNIEIPAASNGGSAVVKDSTNPLGVTSINTGGAAFIATLVNKLKGENANNIVVGAGDLVTFLAQGGDNFTVMKAGKNYNATGYKDIDAFVAYMKANPKLVPPANRITKLN